VALCLLFAYLVSSVDWLSKKEIRITSIFVIVLTLCAFVSYKRNILWQTPMKFLQHELTHTVDNSRVYASVAALFAEQGNLRQADSWFKASIQVAEETGFLQADTLINYLKLLYQQNKMAGALRFSGMALKVIKEDQYKSQIKTILARFYVDRGECEFATGMLRQALKLDPSNSLADELLSMCRSGN
jgi:Tfp pilus assembly protein PilF